MKKVVLALLILFILPLTVAVPEYRMNIESVSPQPSPPGEVTKVSVVVANDGESSADFGPVEIQTVAGIEYKGATPTINKQFELCGGCQQVGTLYLDVDNDVNTGSYPLEIKVPVDDVSFSETVTIEVDGSAALSGSISDISAPQGEKANATVSIENVGTDTASSSVLSFDSGRFSVSPSTVSLGQLRPGEVETVPVTVRPDKSLESGSKKLNMTVKYTEDGERTSENFKGSLEVLDRAELTLDEFEANDLTVGKTSQVSAEIENLGPGEAEKLRIKASCEGAELASNTAFVGKLEDGESIPASFAATPDSKDVSCTLDVAYNDFMDREFSSTSSFMASETDSNLPIYAGIAVILLLVGVFLYRRRRNELEEV